MRESTIRRVENALRADIRWAIKQGMEWAPAYPAMVEEGLWKEREINDSVSKKCGVCAIAACLVRRKAKANHTDIEDAARILRVPYEFIADIYYGVMIEEAPEKDRAPGCHVAYRLRKYAEEYGRAHRAKKRR